MAQRSARRERRGRAPHARRPRIRLRSHPSRNITSDGSVLGRKLSRRLAYLEYCSRAFTDGRNLQERAHSVSDAALLADHTTHIRFRYLEMEDYVITAVFLRDLTSSGLSTMDFAMNSMSSFMWVTPGFQLVPGLALRSWLLTHFRLQVCPNRLRVPPVRLPASQLRLSVRTRRPPPARKAAWPRRAALRLWRQARLGVSPRRPPSSWAPPVRPFPGDGRATARRAPSRRCASAAWPRCRKASRPSRASEPLRPPSLPAW